MRRRAGTGRSPAPRQDAPHIARAGQRGSVTLEAGSLGLETPVGRVRYSRRTETVGADAYGDLMHLTADEIDRFWSRVVKGPRETDCWLWARDGAAIGDDGYGRFWISRDGRQRVLRPHRVAWALAEGVSIDLHPVVEHVVCDNPICVRADGTLLDHLEGSTQAANLARIAQHGRRDSRRYRGRMLGREAMYRRSLALRAAVTDGWDDERIARALASVDEAQMALF